MNQFLKDHGGKLKNLSLLVILAAPFGLYHAVISGAEVLTYLLLGLMGLAMLAALKVG